MVTLYEPAVVPAGTVIATVTVLDAPADKITLLLPRLTLSPASTVPEMKTVPLNPLTLRTVTVELPELPASSVTDGGDAEIVKLGGGVESTVSKTRTVCDTDPPVALTVKS